MTSPKAGHTAGPRAWIVTDGRGRTLKWVPSGKPDDTPLCECEADDPQLSDTPISGFPVKWFRHDGRRCTSHLTTDELELLRAGGLARLRSQADALAGALREFGTHKLSCAWRKPRPSNFMKRACDCGLDAALDAYRGQQP